MTPTGDPRPDLVDPSAEPSPALAAGPATWRASDGGPWAAAIERVLADQAGRLAYAARADNPHDAADILQNALVRVWTEPLAGAVASAIDEGASYAERVEHLEAADERIRRLTYHYMRWVNPTFYKEASKRGLVDVPKDATIAFASVDDRGVGDDESDSSAAERELTSRSDRDSLEDMIVGELDASRDRSSMMSRQLERFVDARSCLLEMTWESRPEAFAHLSAAIEVCARLSGSEFVLHIERTVRRELEAGSDDADFEFDPALATRAFFDELIMAVLAEQRPDWNAAKPNTRRQWNRRVRDQLSRAGLDLPSPIGGQSVPPSSKSSAGDPSVEVPRAKEARR